MSVAPATLVPGFGAIVLTSLGLSTTAFAAIAVALAYVPDLNLSAAASPAFLAAYGAALFTLGGLVRRLTGRPK
jgi:hypothetical protein